MFALTYISFQAFLSPFCYLSYLMMHFIYSLYFGFIWSLVINLVYFTPRHFSLNIINQSSIYLYIFLVEVKLVKHTNLNYTIWWVLKSKYTLVSFKILNITIIPKKSFVSFPSQFLFLLMSARCNNCYDFHHRLI